jgi:hypothetical protein
MAIPLLSVIIALLGSALPAAAQIDQPYGFEGRSLGLDIYGAAGWNTFNIGNLNDRLKASGYQPFSRDFLSLGFGADIHVRRIIFDGSGAVYLTGEKSSLAGTVSTRIGGGSGLFQVGYNLFPTGDWSFFPLIGVGFGVMELSIRPNAAANFTDVLTDPRRVAPLTAVTALVNVGVGGEYTIPLVRRDGSSGGILVGFRAGYLFSPFSSNWRLDSMSLAGGPELRMSGPYVKAIVGGGIRYRSGGYEY